MHVAKMISFCESEYGIYLHGLDMLDTFQRIFECWNEHTWKKAHREYKRALRNLLRRRGVYTGNDNSPLAVRFASLQTVDNLPTWPDREYHEMVFDKAGTMPLYLKEDTMMEIHQEYEYMERLMEDAKIAAKAAAKAAIEAHTVNPSLAYNPATTRTTTITALPPATSNPPPAIPSPPVTPSLQPTTPSPLVAPPATLSPPATPSSSPISPHSNSPSSYKSSEESSEDIASNPTPTKPLLQQLPQLPHQHAIPKLPLPQQRKRHPPKPAICRRCKSHFKCRSALFRHLNERCHHIKRTQTSSQTIMPRARHTPKQANCWHCKSHFDSRGALFRHLGKGHCHEKPILAFPQTTTQEETPTQKEEEAPPRTTRYDLNEQPRTPTWIQEQAKGMVPSVESPFSLTVITYDLFN
ncbi:uncharacterized protein HRG_07293 [Hirsutella rhossiliensis]|uniref:C2H2-type domain-containing protein n=1 Tax=Hirsutella rhossiliensis TaxID=111463 RepID=A0A9P8MU08_9HYPO|nr:uncharacterized protein HRG_07293 [Hirsutella rhossiliensis]KAH0961215.1 hypothetical protein HRG_07293 [Hirsutella rhossiliensis]